MLQIIVFTPYKCSGGAVEQLANAIRDNDRHCDTTPALQTVCIQQGMPTQPLSRPALLLAALLVSCLAAETSGFNKRMLFDPYATAFFPESTDYADPSSSVGVYSGPAQVALYFATPTKRIRPNSRFPVMSLLRRSYI